MRKNSHNVKQGLYYKNTLKKALIFRHSLNSVSPRNGFYYRGKVNVLPPHFEGLRMATNAWDKA